MSFLLDKKKIELNNMDNIALNIKEMELSKLSKPELLTKCQELGFTKCKSKNKSELIDLINKTQYANKLIPLKKHIELIIEDDEELLDNNETTLNNLKSYCKNEIISTSNNFGS